MLKELKYCRCTSELESPELECDKSIAKLNDVYESIETVGGQDEEVATVDLPHRLRTRSPQRSFWRTHVRCS